LYVIPIQLPALRGRHADLPLLTQYFIEKLNREKGTQIKGVTQNVMDLLMQHTWPGNVRELANLIERMVVLKGEGQIEDSDLPPKIKANTHQVLPMQPAEISAEGICLSTAVNEFEKNLIYQSLEKTDWVKNKAAKLLHVKRTTLVEKIKRYDLRKCA
jgi:DNA-binding NtrC family response regulator